MAKENKGEFWVRVKLGELKQSISDFRAKKQLDRKPITSDQEAILHLLRTALKKEGIKIQPE